MKLPERKLVKTPVKPNESDNIEPRNTLTLRQDWKQICLFENFNIYLDKRNYYVQVHWNLLPFINMHWNQNFFSNSPWDVIPT